MPFLNLRHAIETTGADDVYLQKHKVKPGIMVEPLIASYDPERQILSAPASGIARISRPGLGTYVSLDNGLAQGVYRGLRFNKVSAQQQFGNRQDKPVNADNLGKALALGAGTLETEVIDDLYLGGALLQLLPRLEGLEGQQLYVEFVELKQKAERLTSRKSPRPARAGSRMGRSSDNNQRICDWDRPTYCDALSC